MPPSDLRDMLCHFRRTAESTMSADLSDADLLGRFLAERDDAAFELLVWRHGGLVLNLGRRLLRHEQDAEDVFQAAFLTLARKGQGIGRRATAGSWLYRVAFRIPLRGRALRVKQEVKRSRPCPGRETQPRRAT